MATIKGIKVGTTTITASFGGKTASKSLIITPLNLATVGSISAMSNQVYTGSSIKINPVVKVTATGVGTGVTITKGTDYTVSWSSSVSGDTDCKKVGTITVTVTGTGNYTGTITTTYQIVNATFTKVTNTSTGTAPCYAEPATKSFTYNGSAQGTGVTAKTVDGGNVTIGYRTSSSGGYTLTTAPKITNVSESPLKVYYQVVAYGHTTVESSYELTMSKAAATLPTTISGDNQVFHNTARATVSKDYTGGTLQYSTNGGTSWSNVTWSSGNLTENPSATSLGDTSVLFRVNADNNHTTVTTSTPITLTITQANDARMTVNLASNLVYNGSTNTNGTAQVLATAVTTGTSGDGIANYNIGYKLGSAATADSQITWTSTTNLTATGGTISAINAGTYYIYYKFVSDGNHSNDKTYTKVGEVTIARAKTATASAVANLVYNGTTESNGTSQTGVSGTHVTWSGSTAGINAGSYSATATPESNFAWSDGSYSATAIDWTIARRGQTAPVLLGDSKAFHNTAKATLKTAGTVAGGTATAPGTLTWTNQSRTALGSQTATAYYAATTTNFSASPASAGVTVEIVKASDTSVTVTNTSLTYNGSAQYISVSGEHGGTVYYKTCSTSNGTYSDWATTKPSLTNVGTVYVKAYVKGDGNHNDSAEVGPYSLTITRLKTATASAVSNLVYNGTTESNGTSQTGVTGSNVNWTGSTTGTNAGSYTATATPGSNYAWSDGTYAAKEVKWSIARRGQTAPVLLGDSKAFHNTASASIKTAGHVDGDTASCPGTLTWTNQSRTALGSQTATAYYAATTTNFSASPVSAGVTVTITAATDQSVTPKLSTGLVYNGTTNTNGTAQTIATATSHGCTYYLILGTNGTTAPSSSDTNWKNGSLTAINAGTYYVWYKGVNDGNHSADVAITYAGSVTIARAKTATASAVDNLVYNGTTESNGTSQTGVSGTHVTLSGSTTGTNAGSYTATATPESNFAWSDGTYAAKEVKWSIARRGQTAPVIQGATTTYPTAASATLKTAGTVAGGTATAPGTLTWSNQTRSVYGEQTATAYYAATTTNFSASPASAGVTVKVNKGTPNLSYALSYDTTTIKSIHCVTGAKTATATDVKKTETVASSSASSTTNTGVTITYAIVVKNSAGTTQTNNATNGWAVSSDGKSVIVPSGAAADTYTIEITATVPEVTNYSEGSVKKTMKLEIKAVTLVSIELELNDNTILYGSSTSPKSVIATYSNNAKDDVVNSATYSETKASDGIARVEITNS